MCEKISTPPHVMVPTVRHDTIRPVFPSCRYCIALLLIFKRAYLCSYRTLQIGMKRHYTPSRVCARLIAPEWRRCCPFRTLVVSLRIDSDVPMQCLCSASADIPSHTLNFH